MPYRKRPQLEPTEDWPQVQLQLAWPEQVSYELIWPVVLFGSSPAERAKQTGVPARTILRKAERFVSEGIADLSEPIRSPSARSEEQCTGRTSKFSRSPGNIWRVGDVLVTCR
jgi:hypothetical protein